MVMYDQDCINWMSDRQKTETRRLYNPNKRPGIPGSIHWIKKDRTNKVYGQYLVLSCEPQRFGDMIDGDAFHEGDFANVKEYKKYFYSVNGFIEDNDLVWVMKFLILWTNPKGIILSKTRKTQLTNQMKELIRLYYNIKEELNTYAPYKRDPVSPFSISQAIGILNLYNVKDKNIHKYIEEKTPHKIYSIYHNGFSSEVHIRLKI